MFFAFEPAFRTCEPPSFRSLIVVMLSPSASTLPWASLTTRGPSGASSLGHSWPQVAHSQWSGCESTSSRVQTGQAGAFMRGERDLKEPEHDPPFPAFQPRIAPAAGAILPNPLTPLARAPL